MRKFQKYETPEFEIDWGMGNDILTNSVTLDTDETEWIDDED